ncbi:kinase-like domain, phloem protein 2-like protein [Tanacetum coccineum]
MSLEDIKSATQNFSVDNTIGRGGSGNVYKGVASHANGHTIIAAKRLDRRLEEDLTGTILSSMPTLSLTLGFGLSFVCLINQDIHYVMDNATGTIYFITKECNIFSLGAVLLDILCGKQSSIKLDDEYLLLPFLAKNRYQVGKLDELVFEGIKEQVDPQSFVTFARIAYQCLHHKRERRPKAGEVVIQLKRALEFNEDHELWERKLPRDYKEIIQMSKCPEIYSTIKKEELCSIFSKETLLKQDKVVMI